MITTQKAKAIVEQVLDYAKGKAQGTEVTVESSNHSTSRFANNSMTQNQAQERSVVSVRVLKNGRQARLSTDDLSSAAIRKLVDDAVFATKFLEKDESLLPLPSPPKHDYPKVNRFDKDTAELTPADRAKAVKEIIKIASADGLEAAGVISSRAGLIAMGNSKGLFATHKETYCLGSITMNKDGSTGWVKAEEIKFADLDYKAMARRAADKALANRDPIEVPPGKYRVILEPSAVLDLLFYLAWDFAATSHLDKLSCFVGRMGEKVFGENVSIVDDCTHPLQSGAPFDGEGLIRQRVNLVENGVLKNLVCGRKSAKKMNLKETGHGLSEPNVEGEIPVNIVIAGGNSSLEKMIQSQEKAILLTRVWYIREVDPTAKIVTGMTRDGSFLIENGKIVAALKNLRFNQSLIDLLNNVVDMGPAQRVAGGEEGNAQVVPAMLVDNFNFSSITTF